MDRNTSRKSVPDPDGLVSTSLSPRFFSSTSDSLRDMAEALGIDPGGPEILREPPSLESSYQMPGINASVPSTKMHEASRIGR